MCGNSCPGIAVGFLRQRLLPMSAVKQLLTLGFSPCPNDTFIFNALVHGKVEIESVGFAPPALEDVETLNKFALEGRLDVSKVSFHALGYILDEYVLLDAGAALGRGCGPLLVGKQAFCRQDLSGLRVAIPGEFTTAAMLLRIFAPEIPRVVPMVFSQIIESIENGDVDAGVIIHESRFTYADHGLHLIKDLGSWWEKETGLPIPLGGIVARRSLGKDVLEKLTMGIRKSVRAGFADPEACLPYMKNHARELDDNVLAAHVKLYVNRFSEELGDEGRNAVSEFLKRGAGAGLFKPAAADFSL